MTDFEKAVKEAAEKAVLKFVQDGGWLMPNYESRLKVPVEWVAECWRLLDGPHDYTTEELEGPLLDLAVSQAVGLGAVIHKVDNAIAPFFECCVLNECGRLQYQYMPSRDWGQGGRLVEEHLISITERGDKWAADARGGWVIEAATPLLAAMRALVSAKLGATVHM